jgi:hypothetical protein
MIKADDLIGDEAVRTPEQEEALKKAIEEFSAMKESEEQALPETPAEPEVELVSRKKTPTEILELTIAADRFKTELTKRSFSGRNPELGPMIKCVQCGLRHRDNVKHDPIKYKEGTTQAEHGRPVANAAGWRAKPGKMYWIKELKKFITLTR